MIDCKCVRFPELHAPPLPFLWFMEIIIIGSRWLSACGASIAGKRVSIEIKLSGFVSGLDDQPDSLFQEEEVGSGGRAKTELIFVAFLVALPLVLQ
jgi:hypothetical protein